MPAELLHLATVEDDDGVSAANGREAVRDDERGAVHHQVGQRFLHQQLGLGIEGRGGFVQHQNRRVLQQRPRDRNPLTLTARQALAALADRGLVPVGEPFDEVMRVGGARGGLDLRPRRLRRPVGDVAGDRVVEQNRILRHDADRAPQ